jgi:hypothetical protein
MSKLFTEEQVKKFFEEHYFLMEKDLEDFISIELPTDEEIEKSNPYRLGAGNYDTLAQGKWQEGAKWMRDKIKGGDNE